MNPLQWKKRNLLLVLFLLGLTVRLAYMLHYPGRHEILAEFNDEYEYDLLARNLLEGKGYRISGATLDFDGDLRSYRAPGYPVFLAAVFWAFGHSWFAVRIVQCLIGAATCSLVYLVGETFHKKIGLAAGLYSVIYSDLFIHSTYPYAETLYTFLLTASLLLFLRMGENRIRLSFGGVLWGLAALVKTHLVMLTPFLLAWTFLRYEGRKAILACLLLLLGFTAAVGPWVARNYALHHALCLTSDFGLAFWNTNNPSAVTGAGPTRPLDRQKYYHIKDEVAQSRAYAAEGTAYLKSLTPTEIVVFAVKKMIAFLYPFKSDRNDPWYNLTYGFIFPFWILGMLLAVRQRDPGGLLLASYSLSSFAGVILIAGVPRFREPLSPVLLVQGMLALGYLFRTRPRLSYRLAGGWAVVQVILYFSAPAIQANFIQPFIRHLHSTVPV